MNNTFVRQGGAGGGALERCGDRDTDLTDSDAWSSLVQRCTSAGGGSGSFTEEGGGSSTYTWRRGLGEK
jgi:hypothetical protein